MTEASPLPFRVVIDANIFIRGTISSTGGSALVIEHLKRGAFQLISSPQHLREIYRALGYPRLRYKYGISVKSRKRLISQLYKRAILVEPKGALRLCRDPHDDYLVEIALLGQATHLLTEDADLYDDRALVQFLRSRGIQLIRLKEFLAVLL